jgi:hypothetical protein
MLSRFASATVDGCHTHKNRRNCEAIPSLTRRGEGHTRRRAPLSSEEAIRVPTGDSDIALTLANSYFLNKLSKAARASVCVRGAMAGLLLSAFTNAGEGGKASRATVTRAENSSHSLAWSFTGIRTATGLRH